MRIGWIIILLALVIVVVIVIASRGPRAGDASAKQELVYAGPGSPEEVSIIAPILARFEELNPQYHVRFVHIPGDGYWTKVKTMFAGGVPPDVMYMGGGYVQELAAAGLLLDVRERLETPGATLNLAEFLPTSLDAYTWDGRLYGIPRDVAPIAVYYNKELFDQSQVPYPTRDWTRDDYLAIARRLTKPQQQQFGCQLRLWQGDYLSTLWQSGARILDDTKTRVVIDSPEAVHAFRFMQNAADARRAACGAVAQLAGVGQAVDHADGRVDQRRRAEHGSVPGGAARDQSRAVRGRADRRRRPRRAVLRRHRADGRADDVLHLRDGTDRRLAGRV
jgi:multiple sugar transport system substrate-binding protein